MIENLVEILPKFAEVNHTRCFLHIVNLCAKSIIKQFDVKEKNEIKPMDDSDHELQALAGNITHEEQQAVQQIIPEDSNGEIGLEPEKDDDIEGWIDEMAVLSLAERKGLEGEIRPVKMVLVKVGLGTTE
jgi:uncharacterized protein (UPF0264 family)